MARTLRFCFFGIRSMTPSVKPFPIPAGSAHPIRIRHDRDCFKTESNYNFELGARWSAFRRTVPSDGLNIHEDQTQ